MGLLETLVSRTFIVSEGRRVGRGGSVHEISRPPPALAARGRQIIRGLFFSSVLLLLVAIALVGWQTHSSQREARASLDWPTVSAKIVASEIEDVTAQAPGRPARSPLYRIAVGYEYRIGETELRGERFEVIRTIFSSIAEARAVLEPYSVGATVDAFVDPADPTRAVLVPGPAEFDNGAFWGIGGGLIFFALLLGLIVRRLIPPE